MAIIETHAGGSQSGTEDLRINRSRMALNRWKTDQPQKALEEKGAVAHVISPAQKKMKGWNHTDWGEEVAVDVALPVADPRTYQALLLPGGVMTRIRSDETSKQRPL